MTNSPLTLVLGATGKTGSRVAADLIARGLPVRTAARNGAEVAFDWSRPDTWASALQGVARIYFVPPVLRVDFAPDVAAFLDRAEAAGVGHVTFLSAYGMEFAPQGVATRDVERDLIDRRGLSHTIVRPAWFMQDFSETFLQPIDDAIVVPTGDGAEAFIDVEDIAAVVAAILADPSAHDGAEYAITGPEALTVAEAAAIISDAVGRPIRHVDPDRDVWLAAVTASGVPEDYSTVLRRLTETVASGNGSVPTTTVEKITGRAPRRFAEFVASTTDAWTDGQNPMAATSAVPNMQDFEALDPFFRMIEEGVAGLVDGEHFFDMLAEDAVFEYVITVPGYPRRVEGRAAVAELYRPCGGSLHLDRCNDLAVHHDQNTGVVVLEYASQGWVVATGAAYGNRYISVLTIVDHKIAHWRDYLDPTAVFDALGWPSPITAD